MAIEIERKFLVEDLNIVLKNVWKNSDYITYDIKQVFISDKVRVRVVVRRPPGEREVHYYLTIKSKDILCRKEFEFEIPEQDGKELMREFKDNVVAKSRFILQYKGKKWEIDVFSEPNHYLYMAEIELDKADEEFEIPPGIGKEVTDDERYYNSYLAKNPYKNWSKNE